MILHAHIFSDIDPRLWLKQTPEKCAEFDGVRFTIGLEVDPNADVLIVYTRASWSIPTTLPAERTIFLAGEPEDIHPYSTTFLNQFGTVIAPGEKTLKTERLNHNFCSIWFAGVDFDRLDSALGYDHFKALQPPTKDDKISIVTSNKASTEYHRKRLTFIEILKDRIPNQIELYGRGHKPIADKMDAMLPHKYHLSLENGAGKYSWTEKLSDPLLCWALPFYAGCINVQDELPAESIFPIDLDDPENTINTIMKVRDTDLWDKRKATIAQTRNLILHDFNIMGLIARLTKEKVAQSVTPIKPRLIRAERSLWPEKGSRGSVPTYLLRSALLAISPNIELRVAKMKQARKNR
jgi:hypothetical protein